MRITKGRSIRRHNKKQTKRGNGNKYNGGRGRFDSLETQFGTPTVDTTKDIELDARVEEMFKENLKKMPSPPSGSVFLIMGGVALVCGVIVLPIMLKS